MQIEEEGLSPDLLDIDDPYAMDYRVIANPRPRSDGLRGEGGRCPAAELDLPNDATVITLDGTGSRPRIRRRLGGSAGNATDTGHRCRPAGEQEDRHRSGIRSRPVATPPPGNPGVGDDSARQHGHLCRTWNPSDRGWDPVTSPRSPAETVIASADLALTKTRDGLHTAAAGRHRGLPGTQFTWKVKVTSNGPRQNVGPYVVVDTLPIQQHTYVSSQNRLDMRPGLRGTEDHDARPNVSPDGLWGGALPDLFRTVSVSIDAPRDGEHRPLSGRSYNEPGQPQAKTYGHLLPPNVQIRSSTPTTWPVDQPSWLLGDHNPNDKRAWTDVQNQRE